MRPLARGMVGLFLFAQLVVSAQACALAQVGPAYAFSEEMASQECEGMPMGQNLCVAHCLQSDLTSQPTDFHFLALALPPSVTAPYPALLKPDLPPCQMLARAASSSPPLQILFCSYQI